MTFKTTERNTFKKDPLKGLEYQTSQTKPVPVVEIFFVILLIMAAVVLTKIWREKPVSNQIETVKSIGHV